MSYNLESEKPEEALEQFVDEFFKDRVSDLNDLIRYLDAEDFKSAKGIVHGWKGFSKPYGFEYLGLLGAEIETAAKNQNIAVCNEKLSEAKNYLQAKKEYLNL